MLDSVREGRFHPDRTRSGQFASSKQVENNAQAAEELELVAGVTPEQSLDREDADPLPEVMIVSWPWHFLGLWIMSSSRPRIKQLVLVMKALHMWLVRVTWIVQASRRLPT